MNCLPITLLLRSVADYFGFRGFGYVKRCQASHILSPLYISITSLSHCHKFHTVKFQPRRLAVRLITSVWTSEFVTCMRLNAAREWPRVSQVLVRKSGKCLEKSFLEKKIMFTHCLPNIYPLFTQTVDLMSRMGLLCAFHPCQDEPRWLVNRGKKLISTLARSVTHRGNSKLFQCPKKWTWSLKVVDWKLYCQKKLLSLVLRLLCFFPHLRRTIHAHRRIIKFKPKPSPIMRDFHHKMLWVSVCQILPV